MKKALSLIFAALMIFALAIPCFAGFTAEADFQKVEFDVPKRIADFKLDGVLSEYETYKIDLKPSWMSAAYALDADKDLVLGLNPIFAMSWDENYVYYYTEFECKKGLSSAYDDDPGSMWKDCCIQGNFSDVGKTEGDRLEFGITASSKTGKMLTNTWADYLGAKWDVAKDSFAVAKGNKLIIEGRVPYSAFSKVAAKEGAQYGVCWVFAFGIEGNHCHLQLASGCTGAGKHADYFAKFKLAAAPELPKETTKAAAAAAADAKKPAAAAQTFDPIVVVAVAALVSGAGVVVSKKKRR